MMPAKESTTQSTPPGNPAAASKQADKPEKSPAPETDDSETKVISIDAFRKKP
jgi:hypothetical protein